VGTRIGWAEKILAGVGLLVLAGSLAIGQQTVVEEGKRKAKSKVNPNYPELARRMNIGGKVKVEVVISPDGRVKTARALGGHPVLVQPCLDAVREWRFDPAPEETTQVIEFTFKDQ
jgi:TonB family protein